MKHRHNRWSRRAALKGESNRMNHLGSQHPQVRREMQHHDDEISDALRWQVEKYLPALAIANGWNWNPETRQYELPATEDV